MTVKRFVLATGLLLISLAGLLAAQTPAYDVVLLKPKGLGVQEREESIPANSKNTLSKPLDRLIQFFTETNKPEEVKKWQTEKEKRTLSVDKK